MSSDPAAGPTHADLIREAAAYLNPVEISGRLFGNVAAIAETPDGRHFPGVCIDTPCGTGFCAEAAAIAAMVTAGEQRIARIVACGATPAPNDCTCCRRADDAGSSSVRCTPTTSTAPGCSSEIRRPLFSPTSSPGTNGRHRSTAPSKAYRATRARRPIRALSLVVW